ncbi:MAG: pyridoxal phosphate-dependent aminotransferase [Deltaproteobacteria bacterium]|nr:pyridoxal phosphate-dependent aminotransferase [Deltaproteobacteria bacterium]MBN2671515.1 pyridoxal phosphate-dependent aminotransferase [Deltaproteobacteria bacterium]
MTISKKMQQYLTGGSLIRKLFEEGAAMTKDGSGKPVYDFSLGNPSLDPPVEFMHALRDYAASPPEHAHSYMANAGLPAAREAVASQLSTEHACSFSAANVLMTVGAAGAVNVALKALLDAGDEVVVSAPYFVEYGYYVENHGGRLVVVDSAPSFQLDVQAIVAAITDKTKIVLITNPNNPTGVMYTQESLNQLGDALAEASGRRGKPIYLLDDAPYRKLVYDVPRCTSSFDAYPYTLMATSHSKDLSLPGERIGFLALSPQIDDVDTLHAACAFSARILGFVNAPALMQYLTASLQKATIDLRRYRERRDRLYTALTAYGYQMPYPDGAFYLFPKVPNGTDFSFVDRLKRQRVLTVPGSGFGKPGYFRIAYCVSDVTIEGALKIFEEAAKQAN